MRVDKTRLFQPPSGLIVDADSIKVMGRVHVKDDTDYEYVPKSGGKRQDRKWKKVTSRAGKSDNFDLFNDLLGRAIRNKEGSEKELLKRFYGVVMVDDQEVWLDKEDYGMLEFHLKYIGMTSSE